MHAKLEIGNYFRLYLLLHSKRNQTDIPNLHLYVKLQLSISESEYLPSEACQGKGVCLLHLVNRKHCSDNLNHYEFYHFWHPFYENCSCPYNMDNYHIEIKIIVTYYYYDLKKSIRSSVTVLMVCFRQMFVSKTSQTRNFHRSRCYRRDDQIKNFRTSTPPGEQLSWL